MSQAGGEGAGDDIAELAARLRARQALGRSDGLNRLFDYLVRSALGGTRPKELEVAAAVFGRGSSFDGSQDASVRVAVHRLRRKLDDFYAGDGRDEPVRLSIPRGEYRMIAEPRPEEARAAPPARAWWKYAAAAIALLAALNAAIWAVFWTTHGTERSVAQAQGSAPWAPLLKAQPATLLVIGDYYIFGEIDERAGVNRLVREYGINSREDLDAWLMDNPKAMGSYRDLDLYYLPVGAAFALRSIVPIVSRGAAHAEGLHVVMASDLTPEMLKRNNIVYLGYLSGLGVLREPVFAGSRFTIGETYDELVDAKTRRTYVSQEGGPSQGDTSRRDYGYVTAFKGPSGNRIVVIAGDRDTGLMQAAEALASPDALKALAKATGGADSFEALYEAQGIGRSSLGGRLILAAPRSGVNPWTSQTNLRFPAG
ncbi:hypothetical protein [Phenylobacterium sp.]|uniref:hypothetical protein n=1 Tax=Phenylobacterium sp. TaxID=1871053 RepID=UPI0035624DC2